MWAQVHRGFESPPLRQSRMKCEVCHNAEATEAIIREGAGEDDELYVCAACAKAAREHRQRKSSKTRKLTGLPPGVSMSITEISSSGESSESETSDEPPPIIGAIMNAFQDFARELKSLEKSNGERSRSAGKRNEIPASRASSDFRVRGGFHLEGLNLIGELAAVKRALHALGMELEGVNASGISDAGHVYRVYYFGSAERAKRIIEDVLREEKNARVRLREEMARVFSDSLCRALAVLKNCRLLSSGELFDLLSPMRLAAKEKMLDGITLAEIERLMSEQDLSNSDDRLSPEERDRVDSERADEMNRRFEEVMLDEIF